MKTSDIPLVLILRLIHEHHLDHSKPFAYEVLSQIYPEKIVYSKINNITSKGYLDWGVSMRTGWLTEKGIVKLNELTKETP